MLKAACAKEWISPPRPGGNMNGFIHNHCSRGGSRGKKSPGHGPRQGPWGGRALADCPSWGAWSLGPALGTTWEHSLLVHILWRE